MKKKEFDQLKGMSLPELKEKMMKEKNEAAKIRLEIGQGKVKNVHGYLAKRKEIAKILTLISEKSLLPVKEEESRIEKRMEK